MLSVRPTTVPIEGSRVLLSSDVVLGEATHDFRARALPAGWSTSTIGSGVVTPDILGVKLTTGLTAASTATIIGPTMTNGDVAVDFEVLAPANPTSLVVLGFLALSDGSSTAMLRIRYARFFDTTRAQVELVLNDGTATELVGQVRINRPFRGTLRLVRFGANVWAFLGARGDNPDEYSMLLPIGVTARFTTASVTPTLGVTDGGGGVFTATRLLRATVRGHALIGRRLLDDKVVAFSRQVLGTAPKASAAEIGRHAVFVFGPSGTSSGALTYALDAEPGALTPTEV